MELDTLTIAAPTRRQLSMCSRRGLFHLFKAFQFIVVLSCAFLCLAACGPHLTSGIQKSAEYDACGSYGDDCGVGFQDIVIADSSLGYDVGSSVTHIDMKSVCTNSHSFCFPSTLPGFRAEEPMLKSPAIELDVSRSQSDSPLSVGSTHDSRRGSNRSWSSDYGMFELLNGQTVSCSLNSRQGVNELSSMQTDSANQNDISSCRGPLLTQKSTSISLTKDSEVAKSSLFDVSPSSHVQISPPVLDWGQRHLYVPTVAFLTVANTCNDSILHVYEPFSTNAQFYHCNFSEVFLGPGEVASICFVFLPRLLGSSSAHLVFQTSSGGFLVQVKGYAVESPYEISPLISVDVPSNGRLSKNLSLLNPFNETLYVKEVSASISISRGNISHHAEATCSVGNVQNSNDLSLMTVKDWLVVKSDQVGFPLVAMRPHENWEIGPHNNETIIEIDFSFKSEGKIFGSFCMHLLRSSQEKFDTVMVPLEVDLDGKVAYDGVVGSVSVSLKALVPCDACNAVAVAISLQNGAPHLLSLIKISEVGAKKVFQIKYIEGLLLFPGTATQVAIVTCAQILVELHDSSPEISNMNKNCKLVVLTNDSSSPQVEIPCQDIIHFCLRNQKDSSVGYDQSEKAESGYRRTWSSDSRMHLTSHIKELETAEADEFVLGNWKSQGTISSMSVLDDYEVLFPTVQVGTYHSKWITVKNPSEWPVVMQLILNSGEIIDDCRGTDGFVPPPSSGSLVPTEFATPSRYGFSMAESALTEAYIHPYGNASFGPIFFHPSNRCGWRSSALIRSNLSGVEWLSLRGFGGSLSLALFEGSAPVHSIEFNLSLPVPLNFSAPDVLFYMEEITNTCSQPALKELRVKNTGDLPLEVRRIEVSGTPCGLDGFIVHTCKGFSLEPGESTKLLISYQTDFSAVLVQRELELALATGIFVIPMKANLPLHIFNLCKKSIIWMRLKRLSVAVLLFASLMFLVFCCIFPQVTFGSLNYKFDESSITSARSRGKSSHIHHNQRNRKFSVSGKMDGLSGSVGEGKILKHASVGRYSNDRDGASEQGITIQEVSPSRGSHKKIDTSSCAQKDKALPSLLPKSATSENSDTVEALQACSLTIKIAKDKRKRQRRRKSVHAGLAGPSEVSSSQSGNSTPSSPLSPVASLTPNRTWSPSPGVNSIEARNPFTQVADQHRSKFQVSEPASKAIVLAPKFSLKNYSNDCFSAARVQPASSPLVPRRATGEAVILPSATFPCSGGAAPSSLAQKSPIAPDARAPGPKHYKQKITRVEEKVGDAYKYDIWGDHFSGLHLADGSKDVTGGRAITVETDSNSFFVKGPQALVSQTQPKSVSCFQQEG